MQAQFKRPIILGGKTYTKGAHDVPDTDAKGWFWDALIADGSIVVVEQPKPEPAPEHEDKPKRRKKE